MQYQLTTSQLTRQVFGNVGYLPIFSPPIPVVYPPLFPTLEIDFPGGFSTIYGTPIFDILEFYDENNKLVIRLSDAPIVTVNRPKNIVKTPTQGKDGTIKEFISNDDYHISVNGLLAHAQNIMPLDDMEELVNFLNAPVSYKVVSRLLTRFGITNVVVDNIGDIKPVDGCENLIQYSFNLLSDDAPEIAI